MQKILTIAVPSFNAEATLADCLDSLVETPALPFLDVIIINDGSVDSTGEIAESYCRRFPESVRVIHKENGGHGSGINTAIQAAQGKYFKVVDADDVLITGNIAAFVDVIAAANADVVLTHFYAKNIRSGKKRAYRTDGIHLNREYSFVNFWSGGKGVRASCRFHGICYLTEFYRKTGVRLSEKVFYEDQEYATLPFRFVQTVLPLDLFLYEYNIGGEDQSVSDNSRIRHIGQIEQILWNLWEQYCAAPEMPKAVTEYFLYKMSHILFSYYVVALLVNPDRKTGRGLARTLRSKVKSRAFLLYKKTEKKYYGTMMLYYLGITWANIMPVQHTKLYNFLFKAVS